MTPEEAQRRILDLELFGMRFGLDRMRRLMTALDHPERRFRQIHVVGTNGKSSTTRMTAAILSRHGLTTGAYVSPHLTGFWERIRIDDADISPQQFARAVERALQAAALVNRSAAPDDHVTQFEALTTAAYWELARRYVDVGVIEAGLGGRYDATNVIDSEVQVLTGVGLEHTRWLGPTVEAIAREKLDVVRRGGTLVLGPDMHPDARTVAAQVAAERGARIVDAPDEPALPAASLARLRGYQRRNFAVAIEAARALIGTLDMAAVAAAAQIEVPGRLQLVGTAPLTMLDGAHTPDAVVALVGSLPELASARRRVAVVSILDDKDAAAILAELRPHVDEIVLTASRNPRALPPPTLESLLAQVGGLPHTVVRDPVAALAHARAAAGPGGFVLATGSIYLIADLSRPRTAAAGRASML